MTRWTLRIGRDRLLPPVLGFVDGILNALALAAASILHEGKSIGVGLVFRVGAFSVVTAAFVLFVARYGELRSELVRQARELNLLAHGRLAETALGRRAFMEAVGDAAASSAASFIGALLPLGVAAAVPAHSWLAVLVAILLLAVLGVAMARTIHGQPLHWALALAAGGAALTGIGVELRIA
jgi:VIT1/CCC1 family predicted Fe2+/Mn2+ transporter